MRCQDPLWLGALVLIFLIIRRSGLAGIDFHALPMLPWKRRSFPEKGTETSVTSLNPSGQLRLLTWLRAAAVVATVLALAGTSLFWPSRKRHLVILLDGSESIAASQMERAREAALKAIRSLARDDQVAVAAFAGDCRVVIPFTAPQTAAAQLENAELRTARPQQTDLNGALRFCRRLFPNDNGNGSILLCTDGRATAGGSFAGERSAGLFGAAHIPVQILPVGLPSRNLITQKLTLPEFIHPQERLLAEWEVLAAQPVTVTAHLTIDGRLLGVHTVKLSQGSNRIGLPLFPKLGNNRLAPGIHRVAVELFDSHDAAIPAAACAGLLRVSGPARVLIVNQGAANGGSLQRSLEVQGMKTTAGPPLSLPENAAELAGYSAVILDNIPALDLTEAQQNALQNYVAGGGGLLVIGGESSLGRGEYYATGLEELLPVKTDTRQRLFFNRAHILFILDHSGSMGEIVGRTSKQLAAMQGIATSVRELNPLDEVGILAFDTQPTWVLPFTPVSRRAEIARALAATGEGGGTDMAAALREVIREFRVPGPQRRHVVIMTDGLTFQDNFQELCRRLRYYQVTVSTIGIGTEVNQKLLQDIATWGGGRYYRANLDQIPTILKKETVRVTRDLIQEGRFRPALGAAAPFLEGVAQEMPSVQGYVITKRKELGIVYLQVGKGDPLLAGWRYGNGRAFVFTSDSGRRWLNGWSESRSGRVIYNRFWSQLIRYMERSSMDQGLRVSAKAVAAAAQITVEAVGPDQRLRQGLQLIGQTEAGLKFSLHETTPGRYETAISLNEKGLQQFEIGEKPGAGTSDSWTVGWVWNPPGKETMSPGPNLTALKEIALSTGGIVFPQWGDPKKMRLVPPAHQGWELVSLQNFLILLALVLFLTELAIRSTALGQLQRARIHLSGWWGAQQKLISMVRSLQQSVPVPANENTRTTEAYRYLAERARRVKEGSQDEKKD